MEAFCSLLFFFLWPLCAHQRSRLRNWTAPCVALCQHISLCPLLLKASSVTMSKWRQGGIQQNTTVLTSKITIYLKKQSKHLHLDFVFLHTKTLFPNKYYFTVQVIKCHMSALDKSCTLSLIKSCTQSLIKKSYEQDTKTFFEWERGAAQPSAMSQGSQASVVFARCLSHLVGLPCIGFVSLPCLHSLHSLFA